MNILKIISYTNVYENHSKEYLQDLKEFIEIERLEN